MPPGRGFASLHLVDLGREFGVGTPVSIEERCPFLAGLCAAYADPRGEVLIDARNEELRVLGPSVTALVSVPGCPDLTCWTASIESVRMVLIPN